METLPPPTRYMEPSNRRCRNTPHNNTGATPPLTSHTHKGVPFFFALTGASPSLSAASSAPSADSAISSSSSGGVGFGAAGRATPEVGPGFGAAAAGAAPSPGTANTVWHLGHLIRVPAGTGVFGFSVTLQLGQVTVAGIETRFHRL